MRRLAFPAVICALFAVLLISGCGRDTADVPAAVTAERRDAQREELLISAAGDEVEARSLDRQADASTDPARAVALRLEAERVRLRADASTAKAQVLRDLRDEARSEAQAQRDAIAAQRAQVQQDADRRIAWIIAGIGLALSGGAVIVCLKTGVSLWYPAAAAAAFATLGGLASAFAWLNWILGGCVALGLAVLAAVLLRKLWLATRSAYAHGDSLASNVVSAVDTALGSLASLDDAARSTLQRALAAAIADTKAASRSTQATQGVASVVASAKPNQG